MALLPRDRTGSCCTRTCKDSFGLSNFLLQSQTRAGRLSYG